jgi:hypothetical protein
MLLKSKRTGYLLAIAGTLLCWLGCLLSLSQVLLVPSMLIALLGSLMVWLSPTDFWAKAVITGLPYLFVASWYIALLICKC